MFTDHGLSHSLLRLKIYMQRDHPILKIQMDRQYYCNFLMINLFPLESMMRSLTRLEATNCTIRFREFFSMSRQFLLILMATTAKPN